MTDMNHIDPGLWTHMQALTEAAVQAAIGKGLMREAFVFMKGY